MKKLILAIAVFAAMSISASAAEITGSILSTDIGTLIDGAPCKTYNVDGRTFVIAEDLRGYGFDVVYDDSIRRLTIMQNPYSERTILSKEEINIEKSSITVGQWLGDMFATDITVYLGDEQIEGYAIDGQMVIPVRALEKCAYVEYSDEYKLVIVGGLQHYLDSRAEAQNPYTSHEIKEETVNVYYNHLDMGGHTMSDSYSYPATSKTTTVTDTEKGLITAYWGEEFMHHGGGRYRRGGLRNVEKYTIMDTSGNLLYDIDLKRHPYENVKNLTLYSHGYLRIGKKIALLDNGYKNLYYYNCKQNKDYYNFWLSESELENIKLDRFSSKGNLITENGYLCKLTDKNKLEIIRYNILDEIEFNSYLSVDNKVYTPTLFEFDNSINSIFDKQGSENTKNLISQYILKTDGNLYNQRTDSLLASDVRDFDVDCIIAPYYYIAAIKENGELYIASNSDFLQNTACVADTDVKSVYMDDTNNQLFVYYIKDNGELYSYSLKTSTGKKIGDNIRKIISNNLFITTNDELTNLTNIIATNVKDATEKYILTNNNTITDHTTGKQIFPQS